MKNSTFLLPHFPHAFSIVQNCKFFSSKKKNSHFFSHTFPIVQNCKFVSSKKKNPTFLLKYFSHSFAIV